MDSENDQGGPIAVVTGGNKGIGFETGRQLAGRGMIVYLGARDETRGRKAAAELQPAGDVRYVGLDVTDAASIAAAVATIEGETGRVDVLVNNAAVITEHERPRRDRPSTAVKALDVPAEALRATFETNVFGVVAVTRAFLPMMRRSRHPIIVNVSSPLGSLSLRADSTSYIARVGLIAYASSKAALNAITLHYAYELGPENFLVNAANPGFVATDFNNHTGTMTPAEGAATIVRLATLPSGGPNGTFVGPNGTEPW